MQNPAENLVCALTRMKALEPETCRKGESETWEFAGYGGWLNIGYPENGLFETLAGSFLPNKVLSKGWGASLRVARYEPGYRELPLAGGWRNDAEMFTGVPTDSELTLPRLKRVGFLLQRRVPVIAIAISGFTAAPQALSAVCPTVRIFSAAFISRSCFIPHSGQSQVRMFSGMEAMR